MTKHISQISPKTARNLSQAHLIKDSYHNEIKNAAHHLVATGRGGYTYNGQYSSGNTIWNRINNNPMNSIVIKHNEALESLI